MMEDVERVLMHVLPRQDSDADELADLADDLRGELLELDLVSVGPLTAGEAPAGAKGIGQVGGWLVAQFATMDGLKALLATAHSWTARTQRTVEISMDGDTLKLTAATAQQQQEILDAWLARHPARS
jgi:hypothetical protein